MHGMFRNAGTADARHRAPLECGAQQMVYCPCNISPSAFFIVKCVLIPILRFRNKVDLVQDPPPLGFSGMYFFYFNSEWMLVGWNLTESVRGRYWLGLFGAPAGESVIHPFTVTNLMPWIPGPLQHLRKATGQQLLWESGLLPFHQVVWHQKRKHASYMYWFNVT